MAGKNQHVQDSAVAYDSAIVERRIKPIYDSLDSGNNKRALQECEKVLKKTPNLHCAKALKALTLQRLGKEAEYTQIIENLTNENPTDEVTLQTLTICYRESHQLDKVCRLYEAAVKADPTNEELLSHLFMSYVRVSDFKMQHQSAMALYKVKPKNPYYCWAVMSLVSQATRGEGLKDAKKKSLFLSLAERMLDKMISQDKMDSEQQVQLYILILELQGKYEAILKVLDGPMAEKLTCLNIPLTKLTYFTKLSRWNDVNLICKKILYENVDRWDIWKEYIISVIELMKLANKTTNENGVSTENNSPNDNSAGDSESDISTLDDSPEKAHEFICKMAETCPSEGFGLRGPYLARFELCSRLLKEGIEPTELVGDISELFCEYFRKFGHKPCCVSDLRLYINLLNAEKKTELSARLLKEVGISSTNIPNTLDQMQRHICSLQLSRLLGTHKNLSVEHQKALVTAFSLHYQHGYQNFGQNLLVTDLGPSDPYALLAAHVLYDLAQTQQSAEPILIALVILENLLKNSPSNFHAKLLATRLYHTVGGVISANRMYTSLDIKHLQLDSMGFIHCAHLARSGIFYLAQNLFDITLKMFASNYKDSTDHLNSAYKFGSFAQLDDFMDFRDKLNNSLHYTTVFVDRIFISLNYCTNLDTLYAIDLYPRADTLEWVRDNNDWNVRVGWDPDRIETSLEKSEDIQTFIQQNKHFLILRIKILLALQASVAIVKSKDTSRERNIEYLKNVLEDWERLQTEIRLLKYTPIRQNEVTHPIPSRIHCILESPYFEILANLFRLLIKCCSGENSDQNASDIEFNFKILSENVENSIKTCTNFLHLRKTVETIVNNVEIICISSLLLLLCNEIVKPPPIKKGKKKVESRWKEPLNRITDSLHDVIKKIDMKLDSWQSIDTMEEVTENLEYLNLNNEINNELMTSVRDNVIESHSVAVKEIQSVLKSKSKLLSSLMS